MTSSKKWPNFWMQTISRRIKRIFFFWIPLSDFFSTFVFSEVYVGFLMGAHPRINWSFFLVLYQLGWRKKNESICPDPLSLGNAMKAEFDSWKKLRSQTPEVFHILAHWNFLISAHLTLWFWTQHCNTTPNSTNFDSKSSRMWFYIILDSGIYLVPVPSRQPAYLPPVNKRESGPQQAKVVLVHSNNVSAGFTTWNAPENHSCPTRGGIFNIASNDRYAPARSVFCYCWGLWTVVIWKLSEICVRGKIQSYGGKQPKKQVS